ncbi:DUF2291 family protein [Actinomyces sp.]|uniref:DUF2291 family protein n=1 Tax=Actinomyces sp. TaxID=29317 RepID=UPI0026DC85D1|nr:DUF2291 family protein [Actinomyces sp.]MDO4901080.1 DUF2291 family protein [Actinomyces sp.]
MTRIRQTRDGRPWGGVVKAVVAVVILAICFLGTTFMTPKEAEAVLTAGATDPVAYANEHYDSTIAYINDTATDLAALIEDLQADEEATSEELGKRDGEAAYTFAVTATGTVQEGGFGQVDLAVDGVPAGVTVSVQTGPAVMGTALRDVTGEVTFDMFENQIDYAQVGLSLNEPLKNGVLADNNLAAMIGQKITVVGALAYSDPAHVVITPISIKAAS